MAGLAHLRERLGESSTWCRVAEPEAGAMLGFAAFKPLRTEFGTGELVEGAAHLWMLFVSPGAWGRGVGRRLHDEALAGMRARRYRWARLRTPAGARPARRLYERSGWTEVGANFDDLAGVELVRYELDLAYSRT